MGSQRDGHDWVTKHIGHMWESVTLDYKKYWEMHAAGALDYIFWFGISDHNLYLTINNYFDSRDFINKIHKACFHINYVCKAYKNEASYTAAGFIMQTSPGQWHLLMSS